MPGNYKAPLYNIINLDLGNNFKRAVFISTINAILKYTGDIEKTEYCRDDDPVNCSKQLKDYFLQNFRKLKILQIGYQPRFADILSKNFKLKIVDLDKKNIGKKINNIEISPENCTCDFIKWADLFFVTGTTFVNSTAGKFLNIQKKLIFYGVTCAGPAFLLGLERFCPCGR